MSIHFHLALLLALGGCALIYLTSCHQLWIKKQLPTSPYRLLGVLLIGLGLLVLLGVMQAIAAIYVLSVWIMLLLVLFPYLGAAKSLRETKHE